MKKVIEAHNLTKRFGYIMAVDRINLEIGQGEFFGFLGPNAAGKTTTLRLLTGQIEPTFGSIKVLGVDVVKNPVKVRELVGIVPEQEALPSFLTAKEYLHFVSRIRNLSDIEERAEHWLNFFEMEDMADVMCKDLSRGSKQKLLIASAFIHEPKLVFMDEPLINIDPSMQKLIKEFFKSFVNNGGTIFLCTHILEMAEKLCSRLGIIDRGKVIYTGSIKELKKKRKQLEEFYLKLISER